MRPLFPTKATAMPHPAGAVAHRPRDPFTIIVYATIFGVAAVPLHPFWLATYLAWTLAGAWALSTDTSLRTAIFRDATLRRMTQIFAFMAVWMAIGVVGRGQFASGRTWSATWNIVPVFLFAVTVIAATRRDTGLARALPLVAGVLVALGALEAIVGRIFIEHDLWVLFPRLRLYGTGDNPVPSAAILAFGSAAAAVAVFAGRGGLRLLALAALALNLAGLFLTYSRGPWMAFLLSTLIALVLWRLPVGRLRIAVAAVMIAGAIAIPIGLVVAEPYLDQTGCSDRLQEENTLTASATDLCRTSHRLSIWRVVGTEIAAHPLFGAGPGTLVKHPFGQHPHNGYLSMAFYYGIPCALAYIALILNALHACLTRPATPLRMLSLWVIVFATVFMATDLANPVSFINSVYLYLWLPLALAVGWPREEAPDGAPGMQRRSPA